MEKNIIKLNQTINKISKKLENLKININVEHIKTPNESKREENG